MIITSTRKMTQEERVLDYMQRYGGITDKEARDKLGISRLGARIYNLKKQGYDITDEWIIAKNRYGERTRFKRYIFKRDKIEQENERHIPGL